MNTSVNIDNNKPSVSWVDSHCHFDFDVFDADRESLWQEIQSAGGSGLVLPGVKQESWSRMTELCSGKPWGYAFGIHPWFIEEQSIEKDLEQLKVFCESYSPVAIGETGLDRGLPEETYALQDLSFREQLKIASDLSLPVILHAHRACDQIASVVRKTGFSEGGVIHAFTGSEQQGKVLIDLGFFLGIGGACTHERAQKLRRTVRELPADKLVLETDSPDMRPAGWTEQRNTPLSLLRVADVVADIRSVPAEEIIRQSNENLTTAIPEMRRILTIR